MRDRRYRKKIIDSLGQTSLVRSKYGVAHEKENANNSKTVSIFVSHTIFYLFKRLMKFPICLKIGF